MDRPESPRISIVIFLASHPHTVNGMEPMWVRLCLMVPCSLLPGRSATGIRLSLADTALPLGRFCDNLHCYRFPFPGSGVGRSRPIEEEVHWRVRKARR
ncbi:hypothetical protein BU26DRAFT_84708 [Trematosphaeria pertusa]|uniref:Uncharacterized protein n=1 Tax=Trematosphaeria pertusa TaxID=390896 RepID=A0A6A6I580_9PLEO|nr:uncharacterized protein BU26DRAFT_84708 [Trematosphaeria pertusa]KAF2244713.1 hypothetical protein BU26DRAFT_84708 [Trematosphaeria pertusa]